VPGIEVAVDEQNQRYFKVVIDGHSEVMRIYSENNVFEIVYLFIQESV